MLHNYLKIALRNLIKNKVQSLVAILGLVIGLATTTVILIVNYSELTWDKQWKDGDRIFELQQVFIARATPVKLDTISSLRQMTLIQDKLSDVEYIGNIATVDGKVKLINEKDKAQNSLGQHISYITPSIINIFSLEAIQGDTKGFYTDKQSLILSKSTAKKLFGEKDPIGKTIEINSNSYVPSQKDIPVNPIYKVIAVVADSPKRTSLRGPMDVIVNSNYPIQHDDPNIFFMKDFSATYVKLKNNANVNDINFQLANFLDKDLPPMGGGESKKNSEEFSFTLVNIKDMHMKGFGAEKQGQRMTILYSLAVIIFVLAAVNYINLATAKFSRRQKEISLRKTLGAERRNILTQFLVESLLSSLCALVLTFIILEPLLPWLNTNLSINIETQYFTDFSLLALILCTTLSLGFITGFYPGLVLSRIRPAAVLKANKSHETSSSIKFRNLLVIFQFIISSSMLVSVGIMATQLHSVLNTDLGYESKNIVFLVDNSLVANKGTINYLKEKILKEPGVFAATKAAPLLPGTFSEYKTVHSSKQKIEDSSPALINLIHNVDELRLFDIRLIAGKYFVPPEEDGNRPNIIINEQALKGFGFSSAQEAIGMTLTFNLSPQPTVATIIGVTSKLHFGDLNKPAAPLILMRAPDGWSSENGSLGIRFDPNMNRRMLVTRLKEICKNVVGAAPEGEVFLDEVIQEQYKHQILIAQFAYACATLAMLISCLGLYGLASFAAEKRIKEIGLRKVHGASINNIVRLLLWQFTKPIVLANLIAWPIALYVINRWLENFSQRIDLWLWGPFYCLTAGILAIAIAWLTVGGQAYSVARAKPANALREE
ncbi:ABC transporter permease [Cellvibrio zantedeschiae]|uniref:ABC transporter permease n=1 Tax=Cellvibrio zantedeschiae TaxID=1237077 RepID=A0ABQ3BAR4_9GAMM|nr:ABC transporter permease [Cellvibrio zantedeschiae]GGY86277.1 ABC transporter permease [Cellvibrio zantedeschiae]